MYISNKFLKLQNDFNEKLNSHSYIFYTNDFLKCKNDLENLIRYIFNNDNLNSIENDYVIIRKNDKKNILKEDMLDLKNFFQKTSYINNNRVYLVEEAHKLNAVSANMILKFLEEPLDGVIAFFITTNLDSVLSTIKSRTQIINVFYEDNNEKIKSENINLLNDFFKEDKYINIFTAKNYFKKYDRNMLIDIFTDYLIYIYNDIDNYNNLNKIKIINNVLIMLNNNVNTDYVFDYLFLEGDFNECS